MGAARTLEGEVSPERILLLAILRREGGLIELPSSVLDGVLDEFRDMELVIERGARVRGQTLYRLRATRKPAR